MKLWIRSYLMISISVIVMMIAILYLMMFNFVSKFVQAGKILDGFPYLLFKLKDGVFIIGLATVTILIFQLILFGVNAVKLVQKRLQHKVIKQSELRQCKTLVISLMIIFVSLMIVSVLIFESVLPTYYVIDVDSIRVDNVQYVVLLTMPVLFDDTSCPMRYQIIGCEKYKLSCEMVTAYENKIDSVVCSEYYLRDGKLIYDKDDHSIKVFYGDEQEFNYSLEKP